MKKKIGMTVLAATALGGLAAGPAVANGLGGSTSNSNVYASAAQQGISGGTTQPQALGAVASIAKAAYGSFKAASSPRELGRVANLGSIFASASTGAESVDQDRVFDR